MFLGAAGGIAAAHLPGMPASLGIAVGMGAMVAAVLKLPLSAIVISVALTFTAGAALVPLVIVGVVVAYLATLVLEDRLGIAPPVAAASAQPNRG
jgi:H+/Cl- antiporter ClcA